MKTVLDPCSIDTVQSGDKKVDPYILEEWTNKLRAATDVCDKVKQDMDKLKEVYNLSISINYIMLTILFLKADFCLSSIKGSGYKVKYKALCV